jgi:histidine ammonia-lyase
MKVLIPNYHLSIEDVEAASRKETKINISGAGKGKIIAARKKLEKQLTQGKPIYGVNTGFGALLEKLIPPPKWRRLQENLIKSHALGSGKFFEKSVVRSAMFLRANMLSKGYSGVRLELVKTMVEMLNRDVVPAVYEKGSVGASGDLAPLAFIALTLIGRGKVFYRDKLIKSKAALKRAGIEPIRLEPKEGLALINGTEMMSAQATKNTLWAQRLIELADIAGALSFAALRGNIKAFDLRFSELKPYPGQMKSTQCLRTFMPSDLGAASTQDAYCLRCMPQVHGAVREGLRFTREIVEIEINSVTDNPLIFENEIVSGGNFHGQTLALAMDNLAISLCTLGGISERRISRLLDPELSGLPAFLAPSPGINSGLMMTQLLAASLVAESKVLSTPASIQSLPTSANQEDFVSMGMDGALKAKRISENTETILALELICSCQAIELAKRRLSRKLKEHFDLVRSAVPFLNQDQELTPHLQALLKCLKDYDI